MLEVQLFDRSGRYTRLTDAGEIWLEYARRALRDLEEGGAPCMTQKICSVVNSASP
jgi:DNA-binding transcriptional LysR family regulator